MKWGEAWNRNDPVNLSLKQFMEILEIEIQIGPGLCTIIFLQYTKSLQSSAVCAAAPQNMR